MKIVKMPKTSILNRSTVAFWKKEEGDIVEEGEAIFDVETGKATISIRSPYKGKLKKILVTNGYSCKVGEPVAYIEEEIEN